ncbi:hypothetical protein QM027_03165 [Campylobacter concisus]
MQIYLSHLFAPSSSAHLCKEVKFCSVGAISKIFECDFSMFYGVISIIVCASITNLVLNQYKFGFEAQLYLF